MNRLPQRELPYFAPPAGQDLSVAQQNELLDRAITMNGFRGLIEGRSQKNLQSMNKLLYARYEEMRNVVNSPHAGGMTHIDNINKCIALIDLLIELRTKGDLGTNSFLNSMKMLMEGSLEEAKSATKTVSGILAEQAAKLKSAAVTTPTPARPQRKSPFSRL